MSRVWNSMEFNRVYKRFVCQEGFKFGGNDYYERYRSRYKECIRRLGKLAPPHPVDVLDIGGGSLALLAAKLWGDRAVAADLPGPHLDYVASHGVSALCWNLCKSDPPLATKFDFIFLSEVIEHLPTPGYFVLRTLAGMLRPGGVLICTTPNLYRLRNVVYMAIGHPIFDYFQYPDNDTALGHVLEYSYGHLDWQFRKAGFEEYQVEYQQFHHIPTNPLHRPLALLGYPLHIVPRWRDYLMATAVAPVRQPSTNQA